MYANKCIITLYGWKFSRVENFVQFALFRKFRGY